MRMSGTNRNSLALAGGVVLIAGLAWGKLVRLASPAGHHTIRIIQPEPEARQLEPGVLIERELAGGEVHAYRVRLAADQYLKVVVEQRGIDVMVRVSGPAGQPVTEVDSPAGQQGPEIIMVVADASGDYRLEVRAVEKRAAPGRYQVRIEQQPEAAAEDRMRARAEMALAEGRQLLEQGTADSKRRAIEKLQAALPVWHALGDQHGEARTLQVLGWTYGSLDYYHQAIEFHNRAGRLFQTLKDRHREAQTLHAIGEMYSALDENQKALDSFDQALELARAIEVPWIEGNSLLSIGEIHKLLGDPQTARRYFDQALEALRIAGDQRGEATALYGIGSIYRLEGELEAALDYYNRSLTLARSVRDRPQEGYTLTEMGWVYTSLGEHEKALNCLNRALILRHGQGYRAGEGVTLYSIGTVFEDVGQWQKALQYYERALELQRRVGDQSGEAGTLYRIAGVARDRGQLAEALNHMEVALDIIESLRTRVASQRLRASFMASKQEHYQFTIDLLMQLHQREPSKRHDRAALQASERARARSLLELLTEAGADIRQGVDPALLQRERVLKQQLNAKAERLRRLLSGEHNEEQTAAIKKELESLLTEYKETQGQIRANSPRYAALTQPQPLSLKRIQQEALDEETLLLEYALGKERSYLWAVTPASLVSAELPPRARIEAVARRVYELLTTRSQPVVGEDFAQRRQRLARADAAYWEAAAELSQMLLGPVARELGQKRLLVVSDGVLQYIPFAALPKPVNRESGIEDRGSSQESRIPNPELLIVDHEIVSLPSASVLAMQRRQLAGREPAPKLAAVLADPVFERQDPRVRQRRIVQANPGGPAETADQTPDVRPEVRRSARDAGLVGFSRLKNSRREAEAMMKLAPTGQSWKALDFAANRAAATSSDLGRYRLVHFAAHGLINSRHPALSGLVLSLVDEQGRLQDGFLRLHDIYNLELGADLVVLSACRTALGKEIKGEGLVGMTRGFLYAGAAAVVASLWSVQDRATAELMRRFYRRLLGEELRPAAALRAAQVSMWQEKEKWWDEPYFWAAFVLQGEWQ